jgi:sugar phosphate isomerase/epimerase
VDGRGSARRRAALGDAIYYVHAKDTRIDPAMPASTASSTPSPAAISRRAHGATSRSASATTKRGGGKFVVALAARRYDGVLSIEHEDPAMSAEEGVEKSVELLRRVIVTGRSGALGCA